MEPHDLPPPIDVIIRKKRIIYALISTALVLILVVGGIFMLRPATFDVIRAVLTDTFDRAPVS